jgi:anti-sigma regulatory factor (Ser/Thr protein kinase)
VPAVRRFVAGVLQLWREEATTADAELVASELATNAVLHADSPFRVSVDRSIGVVCIAIQDAVEGLAEQQPPSRDEMTGRGMAIVNALSRRWGCDALPAGKVVWAELAANRGPLARSATLSA